MSGNQSSKSLSIFDYIREINKLSSDILSPAKFKILVEIAMRLGDNGKAWPKNKEISINTAIKPSSVKVLMSQLKKENFINIERRDGVRVIYLCHPTEKKRLMVINQNGKRLMVINQKVNGDLPFAATPIKRKIKEKIKEKSEQPGASPDSFNNFHPYLDEIMEAMPELISGEISRVFINKCLWDKNGDRPYFYWLFNNCYGKKDPAGWVAGGLIKYYAGYLKVGGVGAANDRF